MLFVINGLCFTVNLVFVACLFYDGHYSYTAIFAPGLIMSAIGLYITADTTSDE